MDCHGGRYQIKTRKARTTTTRSSSMQSPCQRATHPHRTPRAPLQPIQVKVKRTLELVTTDFVGPLKKSRNGNVYIVEVCDQKSKFAWFRAMRSQEARLLAPVLVKIQMEFGIFEQILSDQGPNYESHLIAQMCELMDILKRRTTPYHAMGDGLSEAQNKCLIKMIKTSINDQHSNWDEILPQFQYAYNVSVHSTTGVTPFFMMFGREPKLPAELISEHPRSTCRQRMKISSST